MDKSWPAWATPVFLKPYRERLEKSLLGSRLAKGAFWNLTGTVISRGLNLGSAVIAARMLGKIGLGELGIIQSTVNMFGVFAGLGIGLTATKHLSELRSTDRLRAGRIIALSNVVPWFGGGVMAVALAFLSPWLATYMLSAPHLARLLAISSVLLLLGSLNGAQIGSLSGFEAFRRIAYINLVVGLISFPVTITCVWLLGLEGALLASIAIQLLNCILNHYGLRAEARANGIPLTYNGLAKESRIILNFSLPALISGAMVAPIYWICNMMLVRRPDGYAQMGLFNAANQWFVALFFLPEIFGRAALPVLSECLSQRDTVNSRKIIVFYIKANAFIISPIVIVGCLASPIIMSSYGPGFREAWPILTVVLITAGILAFQTPVAQIIAASGRMWLGTLMNLGWASSFIVLTVLLVKSGAFGLAMARLIAYGLHAIWTMAFAMNFLSQR